MWQPNGSQAYRRILATLLAACLVAFAAGCDDDDDNNDFPDIGDDVGDVAGDADDTGVDADVAQDAPADAPEDAPADAPPDAPDDADVTADAAFETTLDISVCDPSTATFTEVIDNAFFPFPVGKTLTLEGDDNGTTLQLVITALDETEEVAGVTTQVIEERETADGSLVEVSRNFFAQNDEGTVCYFGEDVEIYEDGVVVDDEGAWRAGEDNAVPGIIMPADPQVGQAYLQEVAPGVAEDRAVHISMGDEVTVPFDTYTDTLTVDEDSPIDPDAESTKIYARGIGYIVDDALELTQVETP